jgi:hypothetical protein
MRRRGNISGIRRDFSFRKKMKVKNIKRGNKKINGTIFLFLVGKIRKRFFKFAFEHLVLINYSSHIVGEYYWEWDGI